MSTGTLSDFLGWASIGCWLFAQFPQVLENIRRQSCDGLALPFLLNWLLGDITNLIGCVLTHQLPFQTILASYFVSIDFMLFSQYFYYLPRIRSIAQAQSTTHSPLEGEYGHGSRHHYRALSTAAAGVAIAAAMAAEHDGETSVTRRRTASSVAAQTRAGSGVSHVAEVMEEADDSFDVNALGALTESFHSESGKRRGTWSAERGSGSVNRVHHHPHHPPRLHTSLIMTPADERDRAADVIAGRGRPRERQVVASPVEIDLDVEGQGIGHVRGATASSQSTVRERMSSRASKRSAGLVFLGVWALFGFGTLSSPASRRKSVIPSESTGVVLSPNFETVNMQVYPNQDQDLISESFEHTSFDIQVPDAVLNTQGEESYSERVIGRFFAWLCTTLYFTSRLPQIWKNYKRKSVEGLSMYLFVFAFLGNVFYVLSILSSPRMLNAPHDEAAAFFFESIPYLIGSGGTLVFDITIVTQSFLYRPKNSLIHSSNFIPRPAHGLSQSYSYSSYSVGDPKHRVYARGRSHSSAAAPSPVPPQRTSSVTQLTTTREQQHQQQSHAGMYSQQTQASTRPRSQSATRGRANSHPHLHGMARAGSTGGVQTVPEEAQPLLAWPGATEDGQGHDLPEPDTLYGASDGARAWTHRRRDTLSTDGGTDMDSPV